jgi:hypothetical protein
VPGRKFKYAPYLTSIANCPPSQCVEKDRDAYRWVHAKPSTADFIPIPLMSKVEKRPIDSTDLIEPCEAYSLSMWDTREIAIARLKGAISHQPPAKKAEYMEKKGDSVALIHLTNSHGVSSESNKKGHFSLFEYEGVELYNQIMEIFNIFETNGGS